MSANPVSKRSAVVVQKQGKAIIDLDVENKRVLLMLPDGQIEAIACKTASGGPNRHVKSEVENLAKRWFRKHLGRGLKLGVGSIEWPKDVLEFVLYLETCTCPDSLCMDGLHRSDCPALSLMTSWPLKTETV